MVITMSVFKLARDPKDGAPLSCNFEVFGERASTIACSKPATQTLSPEDFHRFAAYSIKARTTWIPAGRNYCHDHSEVLNSVVPFLPQ